MRIENLEKAPEEAKSIIVTNRLGYLLILDP